jgi:hypothetical protein
MSSNSLEDCWGPKKKAQLSEALGEEPWNSLINTVKWYLLTAPVSDWVDGLIGSSGLLLVIFHQLVGPVQS